MPELSVTVGILAFQGAFDEHVYSLTRASEQLTNEDGDITITMETKIIRRTHELDGLDGLIIPGGESTTMSKFLQKNNFKQALDKWMSGGNGGPRPPVWGTCAGMILLANGVQETKQGGQATLGGVDITVDRNKYGRQNESFESTVTLTNDELAQGNPEYKGIFIRAPGINSVDSQQVETLAVLESNDGEKEPVAVRQNNLLVTSFHPELTEDFRWHRDFLQQILKNKKQ